MRISIARLVFVFLILQTLSRFAPAKDLGWQPQKTWLFVVGVLSWKHSEMFGSFPVKNRRDNIVGDFFKKSGIPGSQIVYLQEKRRTHQRIEPDLPEQF